MSDDKNEGNPGFVFKLVTAIIIVLLVMIFLVTHTVIVKDNQTVTIDKQTHKVTVTQQKAKCDCCENCKGINDK